MEKDDIIQLFFMFWNWLTGGIKKIWNLSWCWALNKKKEDCQDKKNN